MSRKGLLKDPYRRDSKQAAYAGFTSCLRRDEEFRSWDRRQNRLCPRCRNEPAREPSEEPRQPLPLFVRRPRDMGEL
jgi:hypothetical protein